MRKLLYNKIMILIMSALMIMMLTVPAFAQTYMDDGYGTAGSFKQGQASQYSTPNAVHVTVTIESKKQSSNQITYRKIPITLPAVTGGKSYTVRDALKAVQDDADNHLQFLDDDGDPITNTSTYFKSVKDTTNNVTYSPSGILTSYDGWFFRLNGRVALHYLSTDNNPLGGTIADTYLTDNDEINVYFDNLYSESLACECNKIFSVDYDSSTNKTTVNVKSAYDWFTPVTYAWHIEDFENVKDIDVEIFDSTNHSKGTATTDSSGNAVINTGALTSGETYTVYAYSSGTRTATGYLINTTDSVEYTVPVVSQEE